MLPLFLTVALLVRLAVPEGWMPSAGSRAFAIEPCPVAAPLAVAPMHHGGGKHQSPGHGSSRTPDCPFAPLLATGLPPVAAAALPAPPPFLGPPPDWPRPTTFLSSGVSPLPPSTGPPSLA